MEDTTRVEINGEPADAEASALIDHEGWGHFTAMQVRGGRTRGLDFHLARLVAAHAEIYARPLTGDVIRDRIRHALNGQQDASVRVYGYWAGLIVTVRGPREMPFRLRSMTAQHFQRPLARLKHAGSWGGGRFSELAAAAGFDDGLLVDETGRISEGTITNVGFWRDGTVVWPDGPRLDGVTMLVLQRELARAGVPQEPATVRLQDLAEFGGMILCNARGWAPVGRVDDLRIAQDAAFAAAVAAAYDGCPRDEI